MTANSISFVFIILESFILVSQLFNVILRRQDKSRFRFLILVGGFVTFNLLYLLIPEILGSNSLKTKLFISLSGYMVSAIYMMYVLKEYSIFKVVTSSKNLSIGIVITMITCYITSFFLYGAYSSAKTMLLLLPIIGSVFTCIFAHFQLIENSDKNRSKIFPLTAYFGLVIMSSIPLVVYLNVCNEINITFINLPFMFLAVGYYYQLTRNNQKEFQALTSMGYFSNELDQYDLTPREFQIANLLLEEKSFKEIADHFGISTHTATKHGSNLYTKVGCRTKDEFIRKFKKTT